MRTQNQRRAEAGNPAALMPLLRDMRDFLEPRWRLWQQEHVGDVRTPPSFGMCRFTAAFAALVLPEDAGGRWVIRGGTPELSPETAGRHAGVGGLKGTDGVWQPHYWLRGNVAGGKVLVDLTADQFGHEPVVVVAENDRRYRANFRAWAIQMHLRDVSSRAADWAAAWRGTRSAPARG